MSYTAGSFTAGEQPTTSKWNQLWSNDASFADGTGLPSAILIQGVSSSTNAVSTGSTVLPWDDTIPQNTEGDQYMSVSITPKATTNTLVISVVASLAFSVGTKMMSGAIFQDSTANALAATATLMAAIGATSSFCLTHSMLAGTTASTTFKFRAGAESAGTTTFNGVSGARKFGGITQSNITVLEYKA